MILQTILEGLGLGILLVLVYASCIRKSPVGMVHLYHEDVQARCVELKLTTREKIRRNAILFKFLCIPGYLAYVLIFVYAVDGALTEKLLHVVTTSRFESIFEVVRHGTCCEEAAEYIALLSLYHRKDFMAIFVPKA